MIRALLTPFASLAALLLAPAALAQPQPIETRGAIAHTAAGTTFPEQVGPFRRISAARFDAQGEDISASYEIVRGGSRLLVSAYVYPVRMPGEQGCSLEARIAGQAIASTQSNARQVSAGQAPEASGVDASLRHSVVYEFETAFNDRRQPVRSLLYLYCGIGGRWQVKYRATWDLGFEGAEAAIAQLIQDGPWPGRTLAASGSPEPAAARR